jgi:hypothetical protein
MYSIQSIATCYKSLSEVVNTGQLGEDQLMSVVRLLLDDGDYTELAFPSFYLRCLSPLGAKGDCLMLMTYCTRYILLIFTTYTCILPGFSSSD